MADKLALWNRALLHLGVKRLITLTDDVDARHVFDEAWPTVALDGLSRGDFNFSQKTVELTESTTTTVIVGYEFAFDHPADWIRTIAFNFVADFSDYFYFDDTVDVYEERGSWFMNSETFFVRYVSSDYAEDANLPDYPPSYVEFISALLAYQTCERLTQGTTKQEVLKDLVKVTLLKAKSNDARNLKEQRIRPGNWSRALRGGVFRRSGLGTLVGGQIDAPEGET